jgi:prophage antirepressor-like protein
LQNQIITQVCSGGKHTAIITKEGKIYVCGTDVLGLLGFENKKWKEQHKFQKLSSLDLEYITQVACAEFHSLCLTNEGFVYAWGGNLHNVIKFIILEIRTK